jgi:hypothetical protein
MGSDKQNSEFSNIIICSSLHDPEARLLVLAQKLIPTTIHRIGRLIVIVTQSTASSMREYLESQGLSVEAQPEQRNEALYRRAIQLGVKTAAEQPNHQEMRLLYVDFDRLLHWLNAYPFELWDILTENHDVEYLHIGRTPPAFRSHPATQQETERIANELASQLLNFDRIYDILSATWMMTVPLAERLLALKNHTSTGFYAMWPIFLWGWAKIKRYIEVDGQEWETPDRFQAEITDMGYEKWLEIFQSSKEWNRRIDLLNDCLREMFMIGKFVVRDPRLLQ